MIEKTDDYTPARPADFDYDVALAELEEKIRRKKKAHSLLAHFREEEERLAPIVNDRKEEMEAEQEDVEALQGASMTLLFYALFGLKKEKLGKEEAEALAAKAEYERAKSELDHVLNRQVELRAEIRALGNCERDYEEMLAEKKAHLMSKEAATHAEVTALEAEKAAIVRASKELKEAMECGQYALRVARSIDDALCEAQYLGQKDIHGDARRSRHSNRTFASEVRESEINHDKHNAVVRVHNSMKTLAKYLQDFAAELKDVTTLLPLNDIPQFQISHTSLVMDLWFDNIFTDMAMQSKLENARAQMQPLLAKLTPIVERLETDYAAREAACAEIDEKIKEIVKNG